MYNLHALLRKALEMCDKEGIPYRTISSIKMNGRLSRAWGRCKHKRGSDIFTIEICKTIADDTITPESGALAIILHEIIHTCEGCWNHGSLFKSYGDRFTKYGYTDIGNACTDAVALQMDVEKYELSKKYICKCERCGYTITQNKASHFITHMSSYTHTGCGGHFIRVK